MPDHQTLTDLFKGFSDERLLEVAYQPEQHTPEAMSIATEELRVRKLDPADQLMVERHRLWKSAEPITLWAWLMTKADRLQNLAANLLVPIQAGRAMEIDTILGCASWLLVAFGARFLQLNLWDTMGAVFGLMSGNLFWALSAIPFGLAIVGMYLILDSSTWGWAMGVCAVFVLLFFNLWTYSGYWLGWHSSNPDSWLATIHRNQILNLFEIGVDLTVLIHFHRKHVKAYYGTTQVPTGWIILALLAFLGSYAFINAV